MELDVEPAEDRLVWLSALTVTVAAAAVFRFAGLGSGLWYDEIVTLVESVRQPLSAIVTEFPGVNAHPLYSLLAHGTVSIFGEYAWSLRLPAALFGVASVVMAYRLGALLLSRAEGWAAASLLAVSYHHVWFSQNARGYTLLGFLTLASTYALVNASRTGRARDYVLYAAAGAAGIYTHLTMAFVIAGHVLVLLAGRMFHWRPASMPAGPLVLAWIGMAALSAVLYAPFVPGLLALLTVNAPRQAASIATPTWAALEAIRALASGPGVAATAVTGLLASVGAVSLARRQPLAVLLLVVPGAVTGIAIAALGQPLRPRFFFFLSGAAVIFAARGLGLTVEWIARRRAVPVRWAPAGILAVTIPLLLLNIAGLPRNYRLPKQDFDAARRFAEAAEADGATIAASALACLPLERYYGKAWPCLEEIADWRAVLERPERVLVVHTLAPYIDDPALRGALQADCPILQRFPGTLGGGDVVICDPRASAAKDRGMP
jgi:uncharacterized membrane protein